MSHHFLVLHHSFLVHVGSRLLYNFATTKVSSTSLHLPANRSSNEGIAGNVSTPSSFSKYTSYRQFVEACSKVRDEYRWLQTFLAHHDEALETRTTIFDAEGKSLTERGSFSVVSPEFRLLIASRLSNIKTRLVIVTYRESWAIDRSLIDLLGLRFNMNPDFFRRHFYYPCIYNENVERPNRYDSDPIQHERYLLPSEESADEFHLAYTQEYDKMSGYVHKEDGGNQTSSFLHC